LGRDAQQYPFQRATKKRPASLPSASIALYRTAAQSAAVEDVT